MQEVQGAVLVRLEAELVQAWLACRHELQEGVVATVRRVGGGRDVVVPELGPDRGRPRGGFFACPLRLRESHPV